MNDVSNKCASVSIQRVGADPTPHPSSYCQGWILNYVVPPNYPKSFTVYQSINSSTTSTNSNDDDSGSAFTGAYIGLLVIACILAVLWIAFCYWYYFKSDWDILLGHKTQKGYDMTQTSKPNLPPFKV